MADKVRYRVYGGAGGHGLPTQEAALWLKVTCDELVDAAVCGFLWQRGSFRLEPLRITSQMGDAGYCLQGETEYGDNIEDEWLIVHLLRAITEKVGGTVAAISDGDGEFLLIEAAGDLEHWLQPDTSTNRVFLAGGALHIIPIPTSPATIGIFPVGTPDIMTAIRLVADPALDTLAPPGVQRAISERLSIFPAHIRESMHRARCYVPAKIAAVLRHDPQLVAAGVSAFYERDPLDMKAIIPLRHFPPATREMRVVKFSRCLFAQLAQQRFEATGSLFGAKPKASSSDFSAHDLGAKLTIGFEILATKAPPDMVVQQDCGTGTGASSARPCEGPGWERFLAKLVGSGYFRGNIDDSSQYKELMATAMQYYQRDAGAVSVTRTSTSNEVPYYELNAARLHRAVAAVDAGTMTRGAADAGPSEEDDDAWLHLAPTDLDRLLHDRWADPNHPEFAGVGGDVDPATDGSADQAQQMSTVVQTMNRFVEATSSHEGAEIGGQPGAKGPADPLEGALGGFSDDDDDVSSEDEDLTADGLGDGGLGHRTMGGDGDIEFDANDFLSSMRALLGDFPGSAGDATAAAVASKSPKPSEGHAEAPEATPNKSKVDEKNEKVGKEKTEEAGIAEYSAMMDAELQGTTIPASFASADDAASDQLPGGRSSAASGGDGDTDDSDKPVDIDLNLLQNVLKSYSAQNGMAGPVSNMLGSLGLQLPDDTDGSSNPQ